MKSMWMFRTNLRNLEYYHNFQTFEEFKNGCHDFYLMMGLYYLENDYIDEFVVWRLKPKDGSHKKVQSWKLPKNKRFIQHFVDSFDEIFRKMVLDPIRIAKSLAQPYQLRFT